MISSFLHWGSRLLATLAACVSFTASSSASDYQFTYTNPSVGSFAAEYVLEYFSLVDCVPCRRFELDSLSGLIERAESGSLRIVFRDLLPGADSMSESRALFCLQEYPNYLERRLSLKMGRNHPQTHSNALNGLSLARYRACFESDQVPSILSHNLSVFDDLGFTATPAFVLSVSRPSSFRIASFVGSISLADIDSALEDHAEQHSLPRASYRIPPIHSQN